MLPWLAGGCLCILLASCNTTDSLCRESARKGRRLYEANDLGAARQELENGLKRTSEGACSSELRVLLADTLVQQREVPLALKLLAEPPSPESTKGTTVLYLLSKGYALGLNQQREAAFKLLAEGNEIATREHRPDWQAEALLRMGNLSVASNPGNAEKYLRQAVTAAAAAGQSSSSERLKANTLLALGHLYLRQERLTEAEALFERSAAAAKRLGDAAVLMRAEANLGSIDMLYGNYLRAIDSLSAAERIAREKGVTGIHILALQNLGNAQWYLHNLPVAASYLDQALEQARKLKDPGTAATILLNRSLVAADLGNFDQAASLLEEHYKVLKPARDSEAETAYLCRKAEFLARQGKSMDAESILSPLLRRRLTPSLAWTIEGILGSVYGQANQPGKAEAHFLKALEILHRERRSLQSAAAQLSFSSRNISVQQDYVRFLVRRNQPMPALEAAEWSRTLSTSPVLPKLPSSAVRSLAARRKATVLAYWLDPRGSLVWVIGPGRFDAVPLPPEDQIAKLVTRWEQTADDPKASVSAAKELFDTLVVPALGAKGGDGKIIIVPDGILHQVNPEVFHTGSGYWIESATLVRANSVSSLLEARGGAGGFACGSQGGTETRPCRQRGRLLAFGDAEPVPGEYARLTNSRKEIDGLVRLFGSENVTPFVGPAAMPSAYKNAGPEQFEYVHFSSHAQASVKAPLQSALILSPSQSGFRLSADEVMKQPIHAGLVTLASCRSAGTRISSGGLVGLGWAFLEAGAGAVVASLRDVDDRITGSLTNSLYRGIVERDLTPEAALREAKLQMIRQGGEAALPSVWGSWVIIIGR